MLGCAKCKKTYEASLENFPPQKQVKDYFERYK
jgi:hypothetical protein